jgi:hypothetical protein
MSYLDSFRNAAFTGTGILMENDFAIGLLNELGYGETSTPDPKHDVPPKMSDLGLEELLDILYGLQQAKPGCKCKIVDPKDYNELQLAFINQLPMKDGDYGHIIVESGDLCDKKWEALGKPHAWYLSEKITVNGTKYFLIRDMAHGKVALMAGNVLEFSGSIDALPHMVTTDGLMIIDAPASGMPSHFVKALSDV